MNRIVFGMVRILLSTAYCLILGVLIWWLSEVSLSSGVFIGVFITLIIGFSSMTGNRRTLPVVNVGGASRGIDASNMRINSGINTEVAKVEHSLLAKKFSTHVERPELWRDLFVRRQGWELILAGILAGVGAFMPYISYFTS